MLPENVWITLPLQCAVYPTSAQGLRIKLVNGIGSHVTTTGVYKDYNLLKADDTEATVSAFVRNDVKLYHPTTFGAEKNDGLAS